eukprot:1187660-Prymnesium_polylepis.1
MRRGAHNFNCDDDCADVRVIPRCSGAGWRVGTFRSCMRAVVVGSGRHTCVETIVITSSVVRFSSASLMSMLSSLCRWLTTSTCRPSSPAKPPAV